MDPVLSSYLIGASHSSQLRTIVDSLGTTFAALVLLATGPCQPSRTIYAILPRLLLLPGNDKLSDMDCDLFSWTKNGKVE